MCLTNAAVSPVSGPGFGAFAITGTSGCAGAVTLPAAVPPDLTLCSVPLCAQFLVLCPNGTGAGLTNAVELKPGR